MLFGAMPLLYNRLQCIRNIHRVKPLFPNTHNTSIELDVFICAAHPQLLSVPCVKPPSTNERSSILPPSHPVSYSLSYFSEELHLCVPQVFFACFVACQLRACLVL